MSSRSPMRKENLEDLVQHAIDRLGEMSEQQLQRIHDYLNAEIMDREFRGF